MKKILSTQSTVHPEEKLSLPQWQFFRKYGAVNTPKKGGVCFEDTKNNLVNQAKELINNSK